jgi:hypothetical protein
MSSNLMTDSQQPSDALAGKLKRTELQHSASSIPGREIGDRAGAHRDPSRRRVGLAHASG